MDRVRAGQPDRVRGHPQVPAHQRQVARLDRRVRAGAHREAQVGGGERRRVVDAVADHGDGAALGLQPPYDVDLVLGQHLGEHGSASMPTARATASATARLSPVSSTGVSPRARSSRTACGAGLPDRVGDGRGHPRATPSQPTTTAVRPVRLGRRPSRGPGPAGSALGRGAPRPTSRARPPRPRTPAPGRRSRSARPPAAAATRSLGARGDRPGDRVLGGVLQGAGEPQHVSLRRRPRRRTTSWRVIRPVVTVPVLSRTTVSTRRVDSRTSGPLIRMPSWAPRPVPTISAVGVARPSAHGQAMIRTATAAVNAAAASPVAREPGRRTCRARSTSTTGTKTPEIRSASRCTSALPFCASSTSRAIRASWVSAPTRVASTTSRPPALTVAPVTASPTATSTGTDSPVSMDGVDGGGALDDRAVGGDLLARAVRRTGRRRPAAPPGSRTSRPSRSTATSLAPSSIRARSAAPGAPLGAGLQVAAEQDEGDDARRRLRGRCVEAPSVRETVERRSRRRMPGHARVAEEQRPQRPAERGERADARPGCPWWPRRAARSSRRPGGRAARPRRRPARRG